MIRHVQYYQIQCDFSFDPWCAKTINLETSDKRALWELRAEAKRSGWFVQNGKDACPSCGQALVATEII